MPPKRAAVPTNTFGGGPKALDKLTGRAPAAEPETADTPPSAAPEPTPQRTTRQSRETVSPQNGKAASRQSSSAPAAQESAESDGGDDSSTREKVTFYLRPDQVEKLDELVIAYKRRTGRRTNRNALMRLLLDRVDIDLLVQER
ncbi:MAG: hypothetical protein HGA45_42620 [Chloroflexales bacterium]|nr:hypothetical protein [Chloroflexales bacterium]